MRGGVSSQPDGSVKARIVGKCDYLTSQNVRQVNIGESTPYALRPYLQYVDIENTSPITGVFEIFRSCTKLKSVSGKLLENCDKWTDFQGTFVLCENLSDVPVDLFKTCVSATNMYQVFWGNNQIVTIPFTLFDNCNLVERYYACYGACKNLISVPFNCSQSNFSTVLPNGLFGKHPSDSSNVQLVILKNVFDSDVLIDFFEYSLLPNRTDKEAGKLYLMATPGYEDKALLTPSQEHIDAAAAKNWVFADPAELSQE